MANLIVDIGNTALKASWCDGITLGKTYRYQGERMLDYILSMTEKERPEILVLSSVRNFSPSHIQKLRESCERLLVVNEEMLASYGLPSWMTPDRAASIIASISLSLINPNAYKVKSSSSLFSLTINTISSYSFGQDPLSINSY